MAFSIPDTASIIKFFEQGAGVNVGSIEMLVKGTASILCIVWAGWVISALIKDEQVDGWELASRGTLIVVIVSVFMVTLWAAY
ncbi:hypothetical protein [Cysteiniphilum halobium]|uniref:hypothetical protein n=1 Tax=Cysteiniphilum halobium TaxID=2219059 RepID=UPI000E649AC3|nr:hypothetical protein [Cysteiniphilum halobium]